MKSALNQIYIEIDLDDNEDIINSITFYDYYFDKYFIIYLTNKERIIVKRVD